MVPLKPDTTVPGAIKVAPMSAGYRQNPNIEFKGANTPGLVDHCDARKWVASAWDGPANSLRVGKEIKRGRSIGLVFLAGVLVGREQPAGTKLFGWMMAAGLDWLHAISFCAG